MSSKTSTSGHQPVARNRAERRAQGVPLAPATVPFVLALDHREERVDDDGAVYARSWFRLLAPNGQPLCEESENGENVLVLVASVPQKIGQERILTPHGSPARKPQLAVAR